MRPIIFVDVETGGLDAETCALLEVGAYTEVDGRPRSFQALVREPGLEMGKNVHEAALAVNGLTITRVRAEGRNVSDVALELGYFLRDVHIEAHCQEERFLLGGQNVQFDLGFLNRLWRLSGMAKRPNVDYRAVDLASIGEALVRAGRLPPTVPVPPGWENKYKESAYKMPSLVAAAAHFGLSWGGADSAQAHRAMGDAHMAHQVYQRYEQMLREAAGEVAA